MEKSGEYQYHSPPEALDSERIGLFCCEGEEAAAAAPPAEERAATIAPDGNG